MIIKVKKLKKIKANRVLVFYDFPIFFKKNINRKRSTKCMIYRDWLIKFQDKMNYLINFKKLKGLIYSLLINKHI